MRFSVICFPAFLLLVVVTCDLVQGPERVSQTKCKEYLQWTTSNHISCNHESRFLIHDQVLEGEIPHHALLGWKMDDDPNAEMKSIEFKSSGSLISEHYVLTAAHSTLYQQKKPTVVRLGEVDLSSENNHHVDYEIAEIIRHPNFTFRFAYHDIALVRLKKHVVFSKFIRPACLWDSMQMNFTSVVTSGFNLADYEPASRLLTKLTLDVMNASSCEQIYSGIRKLNFGVKDEQLCLESANLDRDSCRGDSGSPAQFTPDAEECTTYIVGVASLGSICAAGPSPEIYTRVASYIDWIESIVWA